VSTQPISDERPFRLTLRSINDQEVTVWAKSKAEAARLAMEGNYEDETDDQAVRAWVKKGSVREL
jgi:hypothetical protein